jgi:ectoine hydroxylase-related dioxygenase (phytanoyl-CoA dioxygenase family)
MQKHGFTVVRDVLDDQQLSTASALLRDEYDHRACMAHSSLTWYIRSLASVQRPFRELYNAWGANDLISSFDGVGWRQHGEPGWAVDWHVDQDASSMDTTSAQAILALSAHTADSGGLQLLPDSHRRFTALMHRMGNPSDDGWQFCAIDPGDPIFRGRAAVQPQLRAGDMVIWDSRTVHRVVEPTGPDERVTAYLSFAPRSWATHAALAERRRFFAEGRATTHWAHRPVDRGEAPCPPAREWHALDERLRLV